MPRLIRSAAVPTLGEEIANSVSHGVALLAAALAVPLLFDTNVASDGYMVVGITVFAATMLLLYLTSTLYHALPRGRAKRVFQVLDHSAIFLFIAGSYTPFTLGALRGPWGWSLLALIWTLAAAGIVLKATAGAHRQPLLSTGLYLAMGWLVVIAIHPLWLHLPAAALIWLVAGGLAYTAGVGFYAADHLRYGHLVWHLLVITGTACHFVAVLHQVA